MYTSPPARIIKQNITFPIEILWIKIANYKSDKRSVEKLNPDSCFRYVYLIGGFWIMFIEAGKIKYFNITLLILLL
jgi:hypothetical protein